MESQNQTQLVPYVDAQNDIMLLYPTDWTFSYAGLSYPDLVGFYSTLENLSDFTPPSQIAISLATFRQNVSFAEFTNQTLTSLYNTALQLSQDQNQTGQPALSVRTSDPVSVAGYPGHRVSYIVSDNQTSAGVMEVWTLVDGNKLYTVTYTASGNKFERDLSDAVQIINSLRIANSTRQ